MAKAKTKTRRTKPLKTLNSFVVVSDTHCNSVYGLCPPVVHLDKGKHQASPEQVQLWGLWQEFWKWVYDKLGGAPFVLAVNGDVVEGGRKHRTHEIISQSYAIQSRIAERVFEKPVKNAAAVHWMRGTPSHVGSSAEDEERLARKVDDQGLDAPRTEYDAWLRMNGCLLHFSHHVGTTRVLHTEATALMREAVTACTEASRWGQPVPDFIARAHRHRCCEVRVPTSATRSGEIVVISTPSWQLGTPYASKLGMSLARAQIGGALVTIESDGYVRCQKWVRPAPMLPIRAADQVAGAA